MDPLITAHVAGVKRAVHVQGFRVVDRLLERSTGRLKLLLPEGTDLVGGEPVELYDQDTVKVFGGQLLDGGPQVRYHAPGVWLVDVPVGDFHYRADKRLVSAVYQQEHAGDIVRDLVDTHLAGEGISVHASVPTGPVVARRVFDYLEVGRAIDQVAELVGWWWRIDPDGVLLAGPREGTMAPWDVTAADVAWKEATVVRGTSQYRNVQVVTGGSDETDEQTQVFVGNGLDTSYPLAYPVARVPTILLDGDPVDVKIAGVEEGTEDSWYWNRGSNIITQDYRGLPLLDHEELTVIYRGMFSIVARSSNPGQVVTRAAREGTTGLVEAVVNQPSVATRQEGWEVAAGLLRSYSQEGRRLTCTTRRAGLLPGQLVVVHLPQLAIDGVQMLVEQVTTTSVRSAWLEYQVVMVEGAATHTWAHFFGELSAAARARALTDELEHEVVPQLEQVTALQEWQENLDFVPQACPVLPAELPWVLC